MGLSIREGLDIAEREAWRKVGAGNSGWFTWGKRLVPVALIASVLGAIGYGAYRAYRAVADLFAGPETVPSAVAGSGTPPALWIAAVVLIVVTAIGVRASTRARRFAPVMAGGSVLVVMWLGVIGYAIGRLG